MPQRYHFTASETSAAAEVLAIGRAFWV